MMQRSRRTIQPLGRYNRRAPRTFHRVAEDALFWANPVAATIRILLADDCEPLRDSLRMALQAKPDFEIVGEATTG